MNGYLDLARLSMLLGTEARATLHPDGTTSESVATHSHMLGMVACTVAVNHNYSTTMDAPRGHIFDIGLVAQYALVHDVAEVAPGGPGDVDTFTTTDPAALAAKDAAEAEALRRLLIDHPSWLGPRLADYERQDCPESRLVKCLDKMLPKLTLALSQCAQWRRDGHTLEDFRAYVAKQGAALAEANPDVWPVVGPLFDATNVAVEQAWEDAR